MLPDYMFCCATILELNPLGDSVQIWMGGLPDAYLVAQDGSIKETICSRNMPLGVEHNEKFNKGFEVKQLSAGESFVFFTDGIIEAENPGGEFFEEERLLNCFSKGIKDPFSGILSQLEDFIQGAEQRDDISLVEVKSGPVVIKQNKKIPELKGYEGIYWQMNCDLGVEDIQRSNPVEEIMSVLGAQTLLRPNKDVIGLLLAELYSNALEHGLLDLSSDLKRSEDGFAEYYQLRQERIAALSDAHIKIHCELLFEEETVLRIKLMDSVKGFEFESILDSDHEDSFGRGISLIDKVCKRVEYSNKGCTVEVDFPVSRAVVLD